MHMVYLVLIRIGISLTESSCRSSAASALAPLVHDSAATVSYVGVRLHEIDPLHDAGAIEGPCWAN